MNTVRRLTRAGVMPAMLGSAFAAGMALQAFRDTHKDAKEQLEFTVRMPDLTESYQSSKERNNA
jgi:hypothetical protein